MHISINNFIFKHLSAKNVTYIVEGNYIQLNQWDLRVYIGGIDEKSPFVYTSVFGVWWNLKDIPVQDVELKYIM